MLLSCALTSHVSSTIEQRHRQPSEAVAGHPTVWSVDSCWRYKTLFDVCHTYTCCKAQLFVAGCTVILVSPEMVHLSSIGVVVGYWYDVIYLACCRFIVCYLAAFLIIVIIIFVTLLVAHVARLLFSVLSVLSFLFILLLYYLLYATSRGE